MSLAARLTALSAAAGTAAIASTVTPHLDHQLLAGFMGGWGAGMVYLVTAPNDDQGAPRSRRRKPN